MALPIEDYALLGDTETAALVGRDGSIDWLCLPRFDSASCFTALLGTPEHGRWLIGPTDDGCESSWSYIANTFVLETVHRGPNGAVKVTDLMPVADGRADVVRRIEGLSGTLRMRHEWVARFGYGKVKPWVTRRSDEEGHEVISAIAGPDMLVLRGTRLPSAVDHRHADEFDVNEGDVLTFTTTWFPSWRSIPPLLDVDERIAHTVSWTQDWASTCTYDGKYRDAVVRSLLVLRLLTHMETGGIVAAPTTSLPESFGGSRNWDYRFCWLRDAALTLQALLSAGYDEEAMLWRGWLLRAIAGDPQDLQIMYTVDGGRHLPEQELAHLPGFANSRPVRIGNGAVSQRQGDVLGTVMLALALTRDAQGPDKDSWALQRVLVNELVESWRRPDQGLWEIRGPQRRFTQSRVMAWTAFDRAVTAAERYGFRGDVDAWRKSRDEVRAEILELGFHKTRNTFVQHYDTDEVDAALLLIPMVGFLPGDDPRVLGTIAAIESDLNRDGFVMRYRPETGVDGIDEDEHPFLACSFWLVGAYAHAGRLDDAHELMDRLVAISNDLGLLAEEYDPVGRRMAGNYPQAFSHLALVRAAMAIDEAERGGLG
ncbi:MAG TPA: glycoside hydrolase family 15 protein [Nocardioidaceae bacterium]|nr:glycoside hydrolase family 15 protein [Nocardioidaceae bacterium]